MPTVLEVILLPGLDGTGRLLEPFVKALPLHLKASVIAFPADVPETYSELATRVRKVLPRDRPFAIVAESFSGPGAIEVAATKPSGLVALILVGTFVRQPVRFIPAWMRLLVPSYLFRLSPPVWLLRWLVAGDGAPEKLLFETRAAWRLVKPAVLASRFSEVLTVNVADRFLQVQVPILYVRGTQDRLLAQTTVQELQRLRPDLEVAPIEAPHFILQRCPVEAAAVVSRFLARYGAV
jgi:pimeloyl-ACP methyl ester carboxylesterase